MWNRNGRNGSQGGVAPGKVLPNTTEYRDIIKQIEINERIIRRSQGLGKRPAPETVQRAARDLEDLKARLPQEIRGRVENIEALKKIQADAAREGNQEAAEALGRAIQEEKRALEPLLPPRGNQ